MPDIFASLIDHAPMMAALAAAGIAAGFLSGLFGIGGGSVLVPVLYTAMGAAGVPEDIRMQVTLGTSFGVIGPTGYRSYRA
ncbi:MAG: sulfite exporter TauE/SafE family protein, partial [Hyphomicrobium sp.]